MLNSPRLRISFKDRVGFVFDVSKVISNSQLNIVSIEILTGSLYLHIEEIDFGRLSGLVKELKEIPGVTKISQVSMMPAEERENKLKTVLDAVSEGIISVDVAGLITTVNPVAEKIFRSTAAELLGKDITQVLSADVPILDCLRDGASYNFKEITINTPKGRLNFLSTGRPLKDDRGNITGAVACLKDMSDVKQLVYSVTKPSMTTFDEILGVSTTLKKAKDMAKIVAKGDSTVLVRGESGTGKELFARAIHMESNRHGKPFVPINCAALPDNLLESELFGYVEGAFTGAQKGGKVGLFEFANNGTIFLDEIGELSPHLQAKLLRVLQEGRVRRIGDRVENPVNVRVIAATNRNLEDMIKHDDFREDLYYRLNVVPILIPPLRQRIGDIPILTEYLFNKFRHRLNKSVNDISVEAMNKLIKYHWPGNVRELENVMERAMILVEENTEILGEHIILDRNYDETEENNIILEESNEAIAKDKNNYDIQKEDLEKAGGLLLDEAVNAFEKQFLAEALKKNGSIRQTAKVLGVSHTTIMNKIKKYGL